MSVCARFIRQVITVQVILDVIIWFAVGIPVLIIYVDGTPHKQGFLCNDASLSFPYKPATFSTFSLLIVNAFVPIVVILLTELFNCLDKKCIKQFLTSGILTHIVNTYGIFLVGVIIQQGVVEVVKSRMGVLRPNFLDVCKPNFNTSLCPGYITNYTCTGTELMEIRDSHLSFPSGHSSLAMYSAVLFSMYIEDRLNIRFSQTLKLFLQAGLVFIALLCGVDRIIDNKHHPSDVVAGFVLGIVVAVFVYKKIGQKVFSNTSENNKCPDMNTSRDFCTCGEIAEVEPKRPSVLLPNEELDTFCQDKEAK